MLTEEEDYLNRQIPNTIPYYHFILTALDTEGHHQLRLLSTRAWLRAWRQGKMFRRPTYYTDLEEIIKPNQGHVIASTACLGSRIDKLLLQEYNDGHGMSKAFDEAMRLHSIFGQGNFYLEVQPAKDANSDQSHVNTLMWELHKKLVFLLSQPLTLIISVKRTLLFIRSIYNHKRAIERLMISMQRPILWMRLN